MTEHRQIQRYFLNLYLHSDDVMQPAATNPNLTEPNGDWVLYLDHLAALRACEERMLTTYLARDNFEAGLDAAREAVMATMCDRGCEGTVVEDAVSAIDALRENP